MKLKVLKDLVNTTIRVWRLDGASRLGAALAFYLTTSVVPLVILSVVVLGRLLEQSAIQGYVFTTLSVTLGDPAARVVEGLVLQANQPGAGLAATVFGFIILGLMSSNMFHYMRSSLDVVWGVRGRQGPLRTFLISRWASVILVLGFQLLLLILFALGVLASTVLPYITRWLPSLATTLTDISYYIIIPLGVFGLVVVIYWVLARTQLSWRVIKMGAGVTAFLFFLGSLLLRFCLRYVDPTSLFGAFGSLLIMLLWFGYIAQIFFVGAEFTKVYSDYIQDS